MNNNLKVVIGFIFGAAAGVGGSYLYFKKKVDAEVCKERNELRNYYERQYADKVNKLIESQYEEVIAKKEEIEKAESNNDIVDEVEKPTYTDYNKIIERMNSGEFANSKGKEKEDKEMPYEPYLVGEDDFIEDNGYEKRSVRYYMQDGIIADADDYIIEGAVDMIGEEHLEAENFENSDDGCTIYIRNDRYGIDFEIDLEEDIHYEE